MERRFFLEADFQTGGIVQLAAPEYSEELKHMRKVLRLNVGDRILLVNGSGSEATAKICAFTKEAADLEIIQTQQIPRDQPEIILVQGMLKGQRMDWLVEKITELQISRLVALSSQHSVPSEQEAGGRLERWQRLARSALKQSEGAFLPDIVGPLDISAICKPAKAQDLRLCLHPGEEFPPLLRVLTLAQSENSQAPWRTITLVVGPEGGFQHEEMLEFKQAGFRIASMGKSILRGETAGLVAISVAKQWSIAHNYG